jgi:segregation and condensation protein A
MFEVKTKTYTGPLEKLLQLIEEKQLEITTVSLAEVTQDFLRYIKSLEAENVEPRIIADFLVVAARLILIKSKVLLPSLELTDEEEADIHDLEHRLILYREFSAKGESASGGKNASGYLAGLWSNKNCMYSRELFLHLGGTSVFYPPPGLKAEDLRGALQKLFKTLQEFVPQTQKIKATIVTIEEKIQELLDRFKEAATQSFKNIAGEKSRSEMIILFLAMLQLFRSRVINLEQTDQFGDIIISKTEV